MEGRCGLLTSSSAATAGDGHPAEAGGAAQSGGARLLWEPCHVPSGDPEGGSERPLHQLAWSQALPRGAPVGDSQLPRADVCGRETALLVWSVVGEAASTVCSRLRHGRCWVAGSNSRS